ncbi:N-acetylglucosaminyl transferase component-domain-containing protein [Suillus subaureus]|uniref:N-acetylglucosaminyl transferase component-domain-containing protein n=1 Tax=Suillus subaureus TaxID=48587 RepID=A0A9P7DVZ8_9AGAM|nr:N-acetylglucosaminyl transferase component-domain-containing protein [Suillus subaureus]KAG1804223.1 N-acetylglucosaminyl transferase component-domain-containing protein [Suillus subaureus]
MASVFWPCDVARSGFYYGWDHPALCVAGVLEVEEDSHADALLQRVARSTEAQVLIKICGTPRILGRCIFSSFARSSYPQPDVEMFCGPSRTCSAAYIYYHRRDENSLRFYALGSNGPRLSDLQDEVLRSSLKHDFLHTASLRSVSNTGQILVNQWNSAKSLEQFIEHEQRAQATVIQEPNARFKETSKFTVINKKFQCTIDGIESSTNLFWRVASFVFVYSREFSIVVQQIESRVRKLRRLLRGVQPVPNGDVRLKSSQYIEFYNTLWIILNDLIIGIALRQFLRQDRQAFLHLFKLAFEDKAVHKIRQILLWLDSWPAGLKLNTELSRFYSHSFMGLIALWNRGFQSVIPLIPMLLSALELGSGFGATMALAMVCDLVCVFMTHVQLCYLVSVTVYGHLLRLAASLWNLFRGRRHNVLRNRTDPWDYDVDQLLLGTILFTLVAYLFPTVLVYYILFATMRVSTILVYASLETMLAFMNYFPLFALMLRVKDPQRSPSDIYMRVEPTKGGNGVDVSVESHPLPLAVIFSQYVELWKRLAKHYHPFRLAWHVMSGRVLDTIPRTYIHSTT